VVYDTSYILCLYFFFTWLFILYVTPAISELTAVFICVLNRKKKFYDTRPNPLPGLTATFTRLRALADHEVTVCEASWVGVADNGVGKRSGTDGRHNEKISMAIQYSNYKVRVSGHGVVWGGAGVKVGMMNFVGFQVARS